jgi:hypothetical protein
MIGQFTRINRFIIRTSNKTVVDKLVQAYYKVTVIDTGSQPETEVTVYERGQIVYTVLFEHDEYKYNIYNDHNLSWSLQQYFGTDFFDDWCLVAEDLQSEQEATQFIDDHFQYVSDIDKTKLFKIWEQMQS